jgi:O-antigen/teichoic acid export membrane protein
MSGIRVTYSGLISFGVNLISVATGLIFTIIVTRQLSQDEFGLWGLIGIFTGYMLVIEPIIGYWAVREISRGENSGKTAFLSSGLFSFISIPFYIVIVYFFANDANVDHEILFFAAILIPVRFLRHILSSINLGHAPQITAYSLLVFEIVKIILAIILIYFFEMGLFGVISTIFIATLGALTYSIIRSREKLRGKFEKEFLKKWLKIFWLPTFPQISRLILTSDVVIFTIIIGSIGEVAYWFAAMTIAVTILHSTNISKAIYSKMLEGGKKAHFEQNFERVLYFIFPLTIMAIVFSKPGLFALNPNYEIAYPVVIFLSIATFFQALGGIFSQPLLGIEKVDIQKSSFKDYLRSRLVFFPTLRMIQRVSYLVSLVVMLVILNPIVEDKINLIVYWSILFIAVQIPYALYMYKLVKKEFKPKLNFVMILKYFTSSIGSFGFTYLMMNEFLEYKESIFEFLPDFIPFVILGISLYLGITYLIDKKTRKLFNLIISDVRKK